MKYTSIYTLYLKLKVEWSDGHKSEYEPEWLMARSFNEEHFQKRNLMAKGPVKLVWGSEHQENIKYHNFKEILKDDQALYSWIYGKVIVIMHCTIIVKVVLLTQRNIC